MRRAIFLDRDGTLVKAITGRPGIPKNVTAPWLMKEIQFEPNLREAMKIFLDFGYLRIIVTNQPDVAYGYISSRRWAKIFTKIVKEVRPEGVCCCPHTREDNCCCKKPKPGMLFAAAKHWGINLKKSFMIGDTENDVRAGKAAGCKTILIARSYNKAVRHEADFVVESLLAATEIV